MPTREANCVLGVFHAHQAKISFAEVHISGRLAVRIFDSEYVIHVENGFIILTTIIRLDVMTLTKSFCLSGLYLKVRSIPLSL